MKNFCLLCLTESSSYTIIEDEKDEICHQIQKCLQLKINFGSVNKKKAHICNFCLAKLNDAHGFFTRIHKIQLTNVEIEPNLMPCDQNDVNPISICQEITKLNNNNFIENLQSSELDIKKIHVEEEENKDEEQEDQEEEGESFNEQHFNDDEMDMGNETKPTNSLASIKNWKSYPWYCYLCIYSTLNFSTLMGHMKSKHDICTSKKMHFQCVDCTMKLTNYCSFLNHVRLEHQADLKLCCDICSELFEDYMKLAEHRKQHKDAGEMEQPVVYHCNHCFRVYSDRKSINKHVLTHDQGLKCQKCDKSFKLLKYLKRHMETHSNDETNAYKCDFCVKKFHRKFNKINHERTHTGERPYKCDQCDKMFSFLSSLKNHQRTHTGESPYHCEECSAKFRHSDSLKEHKRKHSITELIICSKCHQTFKYRRSLSRHMQNIHGIKKTKSIPNAPSVKKISKKSREKQTSKLSRSD